MSSKKLVLIPLMLCFFAMGFVDLVGIASADRLGGQCVPLAGILLVPHLLGAHRHPDE